MGKQKYTQIGAKEKINGAWYYSANAYSNGMGFGLIYKNSKAFYEPQSCENPNEVVYIPEYGFPEREYDQVHEDDLLSKYTRQEIINLTGSESLASELFDELTWQHPESLWNEWCEDSDKNGYWIEAQWAYEKVYLPEFLEEANRTGQAPICKEEFLNNEWRDMECRKYYLERLVEMQLIGKENVCKIMDEMEAV